MSHKEVRSERDGEWLIPAEDAPECSNCEEEMYEREAEHAGGTPTSPMYEVLFECPECGRRLRANRRRPR